MPSLVLLKPLRSQLGAVGFRPDWRVILWIYFADMDERRVVRTGTRSAHDHDQRKTA